MTVVAADDVLDTLALEFVVELTAAAALNDAVVLRHLFFVIHTSITYIVSVIQTMTGDLVVEFTFKDCFNFWCRVDLLRFDRCILPE